jgi:hypothetical protein
MIGNEMDKYTELNEKLGEHKTRLFYKLKNFLNMTSDLNSEEYPVLEEDDELYIASIMEELIIRTKYETAQYYNECLTIRNAQELEAAKYDKEQAIKVLIGMGYKREEIEGQLRKNKF